MLKERLKREWDVTCKSGTVLWSRMKVICGAVIGLAVWAFNDSAVSGALQTYITPKYVPLYLIAGGVFCEIVRRHNASDL